MKKQIIKPEKAFPKLETQTERLEHVNEYMSYYEKFDAEKIGTYILGNSFLPKNDLDRPYVSSLSQKIGLDEAQSTVEALYSTKIGPKERALVSKREIDKSQKELSQINEAIEVLKRKKETSTGKDRYILQNAIIGLYQDRAAINAVINPEMRKKAVFTAPENVNDDFLSKIDFTSYKHIKEVVKAYSGLYAQLGNETENVATRSILVELKKIIEDARRNSHIKDFHARLMYLRMEGYQNKQLKEILEEEYGISFTTDYYSTLFTNICKKIAKWVEMREDENMNKNNKYKYAVCTRCGKKKYLSDLNWVKKHCSPTGYAA